MRKYIYMLKVKTTGIVFNIFQLNKIFKFKYEIRNYKFNMNILALSIPFLKMQYILFSFSPISFTP